ncbi:GNAT family N-acetyltransferase [Nocardia stercoris]|uniref:N-acetyltransferase n=1 Tax=Nocardia stercoris TaxID=2483361 RepID=A0A3M2L372_9NOCA|nr:GNAT family N-acetyltransferase [Nocardia stercoris]RMI31426.1 N-acetyltransferase [Nocardia stercoris]
MNDSAAPEPTITVVNAVAAGRFEIRVDGEQAGFTEYLDAGVQRIFYHTEVDQRFAGRGLAGRLVEAALRETAAAGKRIVPICPFVHGYLDKHHDFDDIVDPVTPDAKDLVRRKKA